MQNSESRDQNPELRTRKVYHPGRGVRQAIYNLQSEICNVAIGGGG
jgi:hypothetical protein